MRTADQVREASVHGWRYLVLELSTASNFADLAEAIPTLASSVERIKLVCRVSLTIWQDESLCEDHAAFFRALGSLPSLKTLTIDGFGIDENDELCYPLPMAHLTTIFSQSNCKLAFVSINRLSLIEQASFCITEFTQSLQTLVHLEKLTMAFIELNNYDDNVARGNRFYNALLQAISRAPKLRRVFLWAHGTGAQQPLLDADIVGSMLCRSSTLKNLVLKDFHINDACLVALSAALESNQTTLQWLKLDLYEHISSRGGLALAKALAHNQTLKMLHLAISSQVNQKVLLPAMAQSLRCNNTVKDVRLEGLVDESEFFVKMLQESNCTLETLRVQANEVTQPQIDLYLKLNKANRRRVVQEFESLPTQEWMDLISEASDDLDCVYHFLHMKPCLCHPHTKSLSQSGESLSSPLLLLDVNATIVNKDAGTKDVPCCLQIVEERKRERRASDVGNGRPAKRMEII